MGDEEVRTPVLTESLLGYHPCSIGFLTSRCEPAVGQCQAGSLDVYKRQTYPWDKYDMVFRIEVDAFPIVFYNETDYIVQENQKKIFCCFGEKGN